MWRPLPSELGFLANDWRGYVSPSTRGTVESWNRLRKQWEHAFTLDVVDWGDPKAITQSKRGFWGSTKGGKRDE